MFDIRTSRMTALVLALFLLALSIRAAAHETKSVGNLRFTMGWGDEPAFSGTRNAVEVDVVDLHGMPVTDAGASLAVEVAFGEERISLPLVPAREHAGRYRASLVPTRPGTYTFHVTGTVKGIAVDTSSTCSDMTFACITDISEIQFPAKDPSTGQLAERVNRALPRAERAIDTATSARTLAMSVAFGATLALFATAGLVVSKRRRER